MKCYATLWTNACVTFVAQKSLQGSEMKHNFIALNSLCVLNFDFVSAW